MSKLIVEMEMPKRCIECGVRLKCKRYVCGLYQDIAEDLNPLMGDKDCLIKGELVQCEKCMHGIKAHGISDGWVLCSKPYVTDTVGNMMHRCDWFCADGERRTDD